MKKDIKIVDLQDILATRLWFYDFLAKSFYMEPNLKDLKTKLKTNIFEEFVDENGNTESEGVDLLKTFFNNISKLEHEEFIKIKEDYNRLFIGPGKLLAPPWESVYLSREKIIFDEHTLAVREFYQKWDVNINRVNKEPDDHIGFELEFMNILISKSIKALEANDLNLFKKTMLAQNEFLEKHILLWIEEFSNQVYNNSKEDYFKGLALFTVEYVNMDKELLVELIESVKSLN